MISRGAEEGNERGSMEGKRKVTRKIGNCSEDRVERGKLQHRGRGIRSSGISEIQRHHFTFISLEPRVRKKTIRELLENSIRFIFHSILDGKLCKEEPFFPRNIYYKKLFARYLSLLLAIDREAAIPGAQQASESSDRK